MKNTLSYKNYSGSVEYSDDDSMLYGRVLGIRALISYEGDTIQSLKEDFQGAVDDYLALCAQEGKMPETPYKGSFNVRISPELHRKLAELAGRSGVSLNALTAEALAKYAAKTL